MSEQLQANHTSSINAAWPPVLAAHNRLRGFYDEAVLQTSDDVEAFSAEYHEYAGSALASPGYDRLSIRAACRIATIPLLAAAGVRLEGALPFMRNGQEFAIVYTGQNQPGRSVTSHMLRAHQALLEQTVTRGRSNVSPTVLLAQKGYQPQLISAATSRGDRESMTDKFADLYAAFDYDAADVKELVSNPNNTIAYIENPAGEVISTAMAETAAIHIRNFGQLEMVEITEAITHPDYRGQGLYKAISGHLIRSMLEQQMHGQRTIDVLYGESNLAMPGVIIAGHENGRRFSYFDAQRLGVSQPDFGILPQNFPVQDGTETRPYNDFALTYVPLDTLG